MVIENKEKDAVIRMMVYIKYELKRLEMDAEAVFIDKAIQMADENSESTE